MVNSINTPNNVFLYLEFSLIVLKFMSVLFFKKGMHILDKYLFSIGVVIFCNPVLLYNQALGTYKLG